MPDKTIRGTAHARADSAATSPPVVRTVGATRVAIVVGDLAAQQVDAVVNAANADLLPGGGVCGALHAAGGVAIARECRAIIATSGRLEAGAAAITTGGTLPATWCVHAIGPIYGVDEPDLLRDAHANALRLAVTHDCRTIAFPLISTGIYGMPRDIALPLALGAILAYCRDHVGDFTAIRIVVRDATTQVEVVHALDALLATPIAR